MIFTFRMLIRTLALKKNKKVKAHTSQRSQTAGTYPGFLNLKHAYENFYSPPRQR